MCFRFHLDVHLCHFAICPVLIRIQADRLDASAVSTFGLVYILFDQAETTRTQAKADFCIKFLKRMALNAIVLLNEGGGHCYMPNGGQLHFDAAATCNLHDSLGDGVHVLIKDALKTCWNDMKNEDSIVNSEFEAASIIDVVVFIALVKKYRRQRKKHSWSQRTLTVWQNMLWALVKFLGASLNTHCRRLQRDLGDALTNRVIPARKKKGPVAEETWLVLITFWSGNANVDFYEWDIRTLCNIPLRLYTWLFALGLQCIVSVVHVSVIFQCRKANRTI